MSTTTPTPPTYELADNAVTMGEGDQQYVLRVKDLPSDSKPREKLLQLGPRNLTASELKVLLY